MPSEDHYRDLVENSDYLIGTHDLTGRILSVNRAVVSLGNFQRAEELLGRNVSDFLPPRVRHWFDRYLKAIVKDGHASGLVRMTTPSGEDRIIQYSNSLRVEGTKSPVVRCYGQDVTVQKRLEAYLRHSQKMEALSRVVTGIIHDFNRLLTAIGGYSQVMMEGVAGRDPLRTGLQEIKDAVDEASRLSMKLLAFTRDQEYQPRRVNLNLFVANIEELLSYTVGSDVEWIKILDSAIGHVLVDPAQMEQAITNLVINARDAMPDGGKLTIETANVDLDQTLILPYEEIAPGCYVVLSVRDTGTGMSREVQSHIFEPFYTTRQKDKRTGLGLSIVYGIVKQSRGHLQVDSEPEKGTSFKIYLPRLP